MRKFIIRSIYIGSRLANKNLSFIQGRDFLYNKYHLAFIDLILYILEIFFESCRIFDMLHESTITDLVRLMKLDEGLLHHDLSILLSCFHHRIEMAYISLHDDIARGVIIDEYFSCYEISRLIFLREDDLTYHSKKHES